MSRAEWSTDARTEITINRVGYMVACPDVIVRTFCVMDRCYQTYDAVNINLFETGWLGTAIECAKKGMRVRGLPRRGQKKLCRLEDRLLPSVEPLRGVTLQSLSASWQHSKECEHLKTLWQAVCGVEGLGVANFSKIFHRTMPTFLPILDSRVGNIYHKNLQCPRPRAIQIVIEIIEAIRNDLIASMPLLNGLRSQLQRDGILLKHVRLMDILLWLKQGEVENGLSAILFKRRSVE